MLAKLAEELPSRRRLSLRAEVGRVPRARFSAAARDVFIQSRDLRPLDRYFPDVHDACLGGLPDGCVVDGEIVIASPGGLDFDALQLRLHPAASRVAKLAAETPASFVAFDLLAVDGRDICDAAQSERRSMLETLFDGVDAAAAPDAGHARPRAGDRVAGALRRRRARRRRRQAGGQRPTSRASARCSRSSTRALPTAWSPASAGTRAAATPSDRCCSDSTTRRQAAARRGHVGVHDGAAQGAGPELEPLREQRAGRASLARVGGLGRRRPGAHAWRPEPLERGQGSLVGTAAHRAGLRGEVRPPAGLALPPCHGVPALAPRQAARPTAATTSSRSRLLTSSRRSSARQGHHRR